MSSVPGVNDAIIPEPRGGVVGAAYQRFFRKLISGHASRQKEIRAFEVEKAAFQLVFLQGGAFEVLQLLLCHGRLALTLQLVLSKLGTSNFGRIALRMSSKLIKINSILYSNSPLQAQKKQ